MCRRFRSRTKRISISTGGGTDPAWRSDGAELFYLAADRNLMAVPVRANATAFEPGAAKVLFPIPGNVVRRAYAAFWRRQQIPDRPTHG